MKKKKVLHKRVQGNSLFKKNLNLMWLLPLILLSVVLVFIDHSKRKESNNDSYQNNSQILRPHTINTTGWKTYENKVYGISLKYPPEESMLKCGGEITSKSGQASSADGSEQECVFLSTSFIRLDFLDASFKIATQSDGAIITNLFSTTNNGKQVYLSVHEMSKADSERNKEVYIEYSPTKTINLSGRYNDPSSITLFDTIYSTVRLK